METVLEAVRDFAREAHGKQLRKFPPEPYIEHPLRVLGLCRHYTDRLPLLSAALLHDVLEDTPVSKTALSRFLSSVLSADEAAQTLHLVVELTDVYTPSRFPRWNRRMRKAKEAARIRNTGADSQTIRYADILDNCRGIVEGDPEFAALLLNECKALLPLIPHGVPELYQRAIGAVNEELRRLR